MRNRAFVVPIFLLIIAIATQRFFADTRDGEIPRVGRGAVKEFGERFIVPPSPKYRPYALNLYALEASGEIDFAALLIHGTCGHGGAYGKFSDALQKLCKGRCSIYSLDLQGHGRTAGINNERGLFRMENWLQDINATSLWIKERLKKDVPLFSIGFSQGGELSFLAANHFDSIAAGVSMNVMLFSELAFKPIVEVWKSSYINLIEELFLKDLRLPVWKLLDFRQAYDWPEETFLYEGKLQDPLSTWYYGFASYRSVFTYKPPKKAEENTKPVLILHGDQDAIIPIDHVKACVERIGGPKNFVIFQNGRHQLLNRHSVPFIEVIYEWIQLVTKGKQAEFKTTTITVPKELHPPIF